MRFPIKLGEYTCRGVDAAGQDVVFDDLLSEGDTVGPAECATGVVVQRPDGLWIEPAPVVTETDVIPADDILRWMLRGNPGNGASA